MANRWGTVETVADFFWGGSKITADGDCSHEIKRCLLLWRKVRTNLDSTLKRQRHYFANKDPSRQGYGFSSSHVWMWELDCEESWVQKNWCFWTVVLEKTLESPLDFREIQPVHPKGGQSWVFIGRSDVEAETPILWPPDAKSWLIWKDPDAVKDWGQDEKRTTEDEMVGWHHRLNGHGFGWTLGVDEQGGLACCGLWGHKESDTTKWLNWTECFKYASFWIHKWLLDCKLNIMTSFIHCSVGLNTRFSIQLNNYHWHLLIWLVQPPLSTNFSLFSQCN